MSTARWAAAAGPTAGLNFTGLILDQADRRATQPALVLPRAWTREGATEIEQLSFGELADRTRRLARGLARAGIGPGERVIVMLPISGDLYATALAVMGVGAAVVLIDGGMGVQKILAAIQDANASAIISVRRLLSRWPLLPPLWKLRRWCADGWLPGTRPFGELLAASPLAAPLPRANDHEALITFTSGSTGRPKGADRTHGVLIAQHLALDEHLPRPEGAVDMPCFPVVTLHNLCCGVTTVMPPVDLRAPAAVDPVAVLAEARRWRVNTLSGAPAYLDALTRHMLQTAKRLPTVSALAVGGAPVSRALARRLIEAFAGARVEVVYGSTEAEPIASVSAHEVAETDGVGHLVGPPAGCVEVELVRLPEPPEVAHQLPAAGLLPFRGAPGDAGEVVVRGAHVNRRYVNSRAATRENKLVAPDGALWHRTGDIAHVDGRGRLWLTGRTRDLVTRGGRVLHPLVLEELLGEVPRVTRVALIAHARAPEGEVVVSGDGDVAHAVRARLTGEHADLPVRQIAAIPMDGRHQSKIDRPALRTLLERSSGRSRKGAHA